MKKILVIVFISFLLVTVGSFSNAHEARIAQSHGLSADRHADQKGRKDVHRHDVKPKSKYDLRSIDGDRRQGSHKHVHKDGHNHGHALKHDHGDAHKHKHGPIHGHDHGDSHGTHDDHGHEGHGHDHGHGGHEHGYDRVWHVGISG